MSKDRSSYLGGKALVTHEGKQAARDTQGVSVTTATWQQQHLGSEPHVHVQPSSAMDRAYGASVSINAQKPQNRRLRGLCAQASHRLWPVRSFERIRGVGKPSPTSTHRARRTIMSAAPNSALAPAVFPSRGIHAHCGRWVRRADGDHE